MLILQAGGRPQMIPTPDRPDASALLLFIFGRRKCKRDVAF